MTELFSITLAILLGTIGLPVFLIASRETVKPLFWMGWILMRISSLVKLPKTARENIFYQNIYKSIYF